MAYLSQIIKRLKKEDQLGYEAREKLKIVLKEDTAEAQSLLDGEGKQ